LSGEQSPSAVHTPTDVCTTPERTADQRSPAGAPGEEESSSKGDEDAQANKVSQEQIREIQYENNAGEDIEGQCSAIKDSVRLREDRKQGMQRGEVGDGLLQGILGGK